MLNKIPASETGQHVERIIDCNMGVIPGVQWWLNIHNKKCNTSLIEWKIKIISSSQYTQKSIGQNSTFSWLKTLNKVHMEGTYLNVIKTICDQPTPDIILNSERLKLSLQDHEQVKGAHFSVRHGFSEQEIWYVYLPHNVYEMGHALYD